MSNFDLRDISQKLTRPHDTEGVVSEFLGYLQSVRPEWRASLAFYDVGSDTIVGVFSHDGEKLLRREMDLPVDRLPARLVRKFFHPSAFFNHESRRSMRAELMQATPSYEPDLHDAPSLSPVAPMGGWRSCTCMTLNDREDVIALLVLASPNRGAFTAEVIGDLIPVKNMASLALAQTLRGVDEHVGSREADRRIRAASAEFQDQIRKLKEQANELRLESAGKSERITVLEDRVAAAHDGTNQVRQQLAAAQDAMALLESHSAEATEQLAEAYTKLDHTQNTLDETHRTVSFMREIFQVLSQNHKRETLAPTILTWYCEHFGVKRCSLMTLDATADALRVAVCRGMSASVAGNVRVRMGQGVAGWVAHHRRPLLVRNRRDGLARHTDQDAYDSDSFISVPLVFDGKLLGVLNLSNKQEAQPFTEVDLDRALLTGSVLAMVLGGPPRVKQRAAA